LCHSPLKKKPLFSDKLNTFFIQRTRNYIFSYGNVIICSHHECFFYKQQIKLKIYLRLRDHARSHLYCLNFHTSASTLLKKHSFVHDNANSIINFPP
jgi:hypothetical protein